MKQTWCCDHVAAEDGYSALTVCTGSAPAAETAASAPDLSELRAPSYALIGEGIGVRIGS
eukprot:9472471-Pyramimonas_sp.AAC.2